MEKAKALHELQKEQWRAISQGQYWVAKDAKRTHKQITTGRPVAEAMGAREPMEQLVVHGKRLAVLNKNPHLTVPKILR